LALIAICLGVATVTLAGTRNLYIYDWLYFTPDSEGPGSWRALVRSFGTGQVWRIITPMFMHFGPWHLIFNMFWLRDLGTVIERRKGWLILLTLVVVSDIAANLGQYFWTGSRFGGMSGIVYALFGYVWMKGKYEPWDGIAIPQQTVTIMLLWLVICYTGYVGPIANTAHLVGLAVGMLFGAAPQLIARTRRRMRLK
jgi:GlpG protein